MELTRYDSRNAGICNKFSGVEGYFSYARSIDLKWNNDQDENLKTIHGGNQYGNGIVSAWGKNGNLQHEVQNSF